MTQQKRAIKRRRTLPYHDVIGPDAILWFSECGEGHFRVPGRPGEREGGSRGSQRKGNSRPAA
jgi:hypothetical protein